MNIYVTKPYLPDKQEFFTGSSRKSVERGLDF